MAEFPNVLIDNILLRLPVKSLLRFRCVSKPWCALIDSNDFVKQHLNHSIKTKTNHILILKNHDNLQSLGLYSLDQALELPQPLYRNEQHITNILDSNGLICLSYDYFYEFVVIWNPSTRKHIKISTDFIFVTKYIDDDTWRLVCGFGYDSVSDDYKVVMILQYQDFDFDSFVSRTCVYSLRSNSWRKIEHNPNHLIGLIYEPGLLACGALHWIVAEHGSQSHFINAFDLAIEEYMIVPLPDFLDYDVLSLVMCELDGFLSIVCKYFKDNVFEVWAMKDYGVRESWTKMVTLLGSESSTSISCFMTPLAYSESGDEVLLMVDFLKLIWYNLEKKTAKLVVTRELNEYFHAMVCLESLVSLGENAENDEEFLTGGRPCGSSNISSN